MAILRKRSVKRETQRMGKIPEYQKRAIEEHIDRLRDTIRWHHSEAEILELKIKEHRYFLNSNEKEDQ